MQFSEDFISVDIESGGPTPEYNLCSIGACEVANPDNTFYIELRPIFYDNYIQAALDVGGFTMDRLISTGYAAPRAMRDFSTWLEQWNRPKMVGFNAPFDWQFINYYFWKFLEPEDDENVNPFGINCVDIKALYMGYTGCEWKKANKSNMPKEFKSDKVHSHNALDDAIEQAEVFKLILQAIKKERLVQ